MSESESIKEPNISQIIIQYHPPGTQTPFLAYAQRFEEALREVLSNQGLEPDANSLLEQAMQICIDTEH
jgi:hypothetical protein